MIELMRLNYERVTSTAAGGGAATDAALENPLPGLFATAPDELPFGRSLEARAFLLARGAGNLLIYSAPAARAAAPAFERIGGVDRQYVNHGHEAMFLPEGRVAPLYVHEADRAAVEEKAPVRAAFSRRHHLDDDFEVIPIPGHTPGATAFLWDSGEHRLLFTGDTLLLNGDEWYAAVLGSSDREAMIASLELIRELDFDVLVPWVASSEGPYYAHTDEADRHRRLDEILARVRSERD